MAHSSPEGIILGKGSKLESFSLSINKETVLDTEKKAKTEEKLYTKEDLEEAHQMGAIFAYGIKSATRKERLEHFNNWINNK